MKMREHVWELNRRYGYGSKKALTRMWCVVFLPKSIAFGNPGRKCDAEWVADLYNCFGDSTDFKAMPYGKALAYKPPIG